MKKSILINNIVDKSIQQIKSIKIQGFKAIFLRSEKSLKRYISETIPENCIVALSKGFTRETQRIKDILLERGNKIYYAWSENNSNRSIDTFEDPPQPEFLLTDTDFLDDNVLNETPSTIKIIAFAKNLEMEKSKLNLLSKNSSFRENKNITIAVVPFLKAS